MKSSFDYQRDIEYARSRLHGTFVRYKGKLAQVREIYWGDVDDHGENEMVADISIISPSYAIPNFDASVKIDDLDLMPIPLVNSYAEDNRHAVNVYRKPARHWKQGMCYENTGVTKISPYFDTGIKFNSPQFAKGVMGVYEPIMSAMDLLANEEIVSAPLSVNFSIVASNSDKPHLYYRNMRVGCLEYNHVVHDVKPNLDPDFDFLQQMMEKELK